MSKNKNYSIYHEDEINLYEFWLTIKKYKKLISVIIILVVIIAILYCYLTPKIYKTGFVLQTNVISNFQAKKYIDNLTYLLKQKEYLTLSQIGFNHPLILKKLQANIPTEQKNLVIVTVEITNPKYIKLVEQEILNYLNNQPEIRDKVNTQKSQLKEKIITLKQQLNNFIKLKQEVLNNKNFLNNTSIKIDPLQIELSIQDCKDKIMKAQAKLKNLQAVSLAVDAIVPQKPYWPNTPLLITIAFISGLFLSIFLALFLDWLEDAKKRFGEENQNN